MTLSENAFRTCPEGVVTLPLKSKLQSINVLSDNPTLSSIDGVLYSKDMKRLIRCPELKEGEVIIPEGVERIEPYAFFNCVYLKAVQMPETLKEFGDCPTITFITNETRNGVMMNCQSLEELVFPQGLTWISNRALANCFSLKKVTLPDSLKLPHQTYLSADLRCRSPDQLLLELLEQVLLRLQIHQKKEHQALHL